MMTANEIRDSYLKFFESKVILRAVLQNKVAIVVIKRFCRCAVKSLT